MTAEKPVIAREFLPDGREKLLKLEVHRNSGGVGRLVVGENWGGLTAEDLDAAIEHLQWARRAFSAPETVEPAESAMARAGL